MRREVALVLGNVADAAECMAAVNEECTVVTGALGNAHPHDVCH